MGRLGDGRRGYNGQSGEIRQKDFCLNFSCLAVKNDFISQLLCCNLRIVGFIFCIVYASLLIADSSYKLPHCLSLFSYQSQEFCIYNWLSFKWPTHVQGQLEHDSFWWYQTWLLCQKESSVYVCVNIYMLLWLVMLSTFSCNYWPFVYILWENVWTLPIFYLDFVWGSHAGSSSYRHGLHHFSLISCLLTLC